MSPQDTDDAVDPRDARNHDVVSHCSVRAVSSAVPHGRALADAAGGLPPLATGGPAAFAERPPIGPGGATRVGLSGPASLLGERPVPRGALAAARRPGSAGRRGPAVVSVVRGTSVTYNRFGDNGRYGGYRYGHGAAYATGAYAAAANAGYVYGRSRDGYNSDSGCDPRISAPPNLATMAHVFVRADESYGWKPRSSSRFFRAQTFTTCLKGQGGFI